MHSTQITRVRRPWRARSRALSVSSCVSSLGSRTIAMPQSELEPTVPESIMCARKYHSHDRSDQLGVPATARLALPTTHRRTVPAAGCERALLHVSECAQALRFRRVQLDRLRGHRRSGRRLVLVEERREARGDLGMRGALVVQLLRVRLETEELLVRQPLLVREDELPAVRRDAADDRTHVVVPHEISEARRIARAARLLERMAFA